MLSCSPQDDATVKCWGYNFYGQMGLGISDYFDGQRGNSLNGPCPAIPTIAPLVPALTPCVLTFAPSLRVQR